MRVLSQTVRERETVRTYNRQIISLGQSSRPYKNTPTPYIASVLALPFPHRSMLTTKLSWAKPNIVPQYTTLSGGGKGEGVGVNFPLTKRYPKLFVWCVIVPMNWSMTVVLTCQQYHSRFVLVILINMTAPSLIRPASFMHSGYDMLQS
jgi:hypothetical protein